MAVLNCGIDPGKKGGFVVLDEVGKIIHKVKLPQTPPDMKECFYEHAKNFNYGYCRIYIEKCQAMPGQGVSSMFRYGMHYGEILGVLGALGIPFVTVPPKKWQARIIGKFNKGQSKIEAYKKAKQLWPDVDFVEERCRIPHDGIVDAALIAEFGRLYGNK